MGDKKDALRPRKCPTEVGPGGASALPKLSALSSGSSMEAEHGVDCGPPLDAGTFTRALQGLKQDIYDKLDTKIDSFSQALRSEMSAVRNELKSSLAILQTTVNSHSVTIKDLETSASFCSDVVCLFT